MTITPEEQKQQTRTRKGRKPHSAKNEKENRLALMQQALDQFEGLGINFRDKVVLYSDWSVPTYYRKKKNGNYNKQDIVTLNMAFTSVLKEVFTLVSDLAKLMPAEEIVAWSKTIKMMGFDNRGEFCLIPDKLKNVINEEDKAINR
jgi:hypothetical protein